MSGEIRRLEIVYTTKDPDRQQADGLRLMEQLSHDEISEDLAGALNLALERWFAAVGHRYLEVRPEGF